MSGALDSGKDILIELSADYVKRIIGRRISQLEQCFEAEEDIEIPYQGDTIILDAARRVVLALDSVSFSHNLMVDLITGVFINLHLRWLYAQVLYPPFFGDQWKTLDEIDQFLGELDQPELERRFTLRFQLQVSAEVDRVLLTIDASSLPSYVPTELVGLLDEVIPIPINFINQMQSYQNEAGEEQEVRLLTVTLNSAEIKSVDGGHLAIGLDVELTQDEDLMVLGPGVSQDDEPIVAGPQDLVRHRCGLPDQPYLTHEDIYAFRVEFTESCLGESDWAVVLDKHIVDAILRGLPSSYINAEGEEPRMGCAHENAVRSFCLELAELEDNNIRVRGNGEVFLCPIPDGAALPFGALYNVYWEVCVEADVGLSLTDSVPLRLAAQYELRTVRPCGDDEGFIVWLDLIREIDPEFDLRDYVPNEFREREIILRDVPTRIGELEDPAGQLTIDEDPLVRPNGLILYGSGSVDIGESSISVPEELLFATGCQEVKQPSTSSFRIRNTGNTMLHVCPLFIRKHPEEDSNHANLFRVVSPPELLDDGAGLTLRPGERVRVSVECSGDLGNRYTALLDIPNDVDVKFVTLNADFRPSELGHLIIKSLDFSKEYWREGCNWPPYQTIDHNVLITNEGPGNMEICSITFSPPDLEQIFSAAIPQVFAPGTAIIRVTFSPYWGDDTEYNGTMVIVTNSGEEREIHVSGRMVYQVDNILEAVEVAYGQEQACGHADWEAVRNSGGRILDVHEVEHFLSFLGGENCCPPPSSVACRCVDLWESTFQDVPLGVSLEVTDPAGQPIATDLAYGSTRILIAPIREDKGYALRARFSQPLTNPHSSQLNMRRWLVQQDGLYTSSQPLSDVALIGEYAYAVGSKGMEVISLRNFEQPKRVGVARGAAGATSMAVMEKHLLVAKDGLKVYRLENPRKPMAVSSLTLKSGIKTLLTSQTSVQLTSLVYGLGQRFHILDLSDPKHPRELNNVATHVEANRVLQRGNQLYIFGKNGIEIFDVSVSEKPKTIAFLPTQLEVRNAFITRSYALMVYGSGVVETLDISDPSSPQVAGGWKLEDWMSEFVPVAGRILSYQQHFLILRGDQLGFRVMRLRRNKVDQEKLHYWRNRQSSKRHG